MNVSDEIEEICKTVTKGVINTISEFTTALERQCALLNFEDIKSFKKGGILTTTFENVESKPQLEIDGSIKKGIITTLKRKSSLKENLPIQTNEQQHVLEKGTTLSNIANLVEKHIEQVATNVQIKRERFTNALCNEVEKEVKVKQEIHMPFPRKAVINKNRLDDINLDVFDDSIIEVPRTPLGVIVLEDSLQVSDSVRVTRARTKGRQKTVVNGVNDLKVESVAQKGSRTRIKKEKEINISIPEQSQKDAADGNNIIPKALSSSPQKQHVRCDNNSGVEKIQCFTAGNKEQQMREPERLEIVASVTESNVVTVNTAFSPTQNNKPICIIKPTRKNKPVGCVDNAVITNLSVTIDDVTTDDRDEATDSPQRIKRKVTQFFTPYENSPVRKYVQAYEKLGVATRSKAKLPTKVHKEPLATQNAKFQSTPLMTSKSKCSQTSSATKALISVTKKVSGTSLTGGRTGSALKASQTEFYERELRRKQKEEEALRKKKALMLAQTEERRRRREEREMKVQQLKMIKEKEKMKQLMSAEKAKEERFKQILAEKEAKFFKQKEEAAQKREAASKKDAERNQQENKKQVSAYLTYPVPLLPTPDCYDSDDNTSRPKIHIPYFQRKENLQKTLYQMLKLQLHKRLLFRNGSQTPNLKEIFPTIQPSKLKRTSSAIWNKTEMSILESMIA
ncbi:hypothetical protein RI129_003325 [Pyrocoelia pectoralis]|uniref:Uncharacterized protein n=1 Tax=Pyrocoelia pectoralis TaxID=417401 RepID=A0AAN7VR75_9COLE